MNVGNIDITSTDQSVTLRMRHLVAGHPGAVLAHDEVHTLIAKLQRVVAERPARVAPPVDEDLGSLFG